MLGHAHRQGHVTTCFPLVGGCVNNLVILFHFYDWILSQTIDQWVFQVSRLRITRPEILRLEERKRFQQASEEVVFGKIGPLRWHVSPIWIGLLWFCLVVHVLLLARNPKLSHWLQHALPCEAALAERSELLASLEAVKASQEVSCPQTRNGKGKLEEEPWPSWPQM